MMSLSEAARAVSGVLEGNDVRFDAVSTDTRAIARGDLFVALRGDRFDGHDFVDAAIQSGAAGAMVDRASRSGTAPGPRSMVVVEDTRSGLGSLAAAWRGRFQVPVIGVVGSNGKTTVKEMIAAILRAHWGEGRYLATRGNLNNDIGLPLSVLQLREEHAVAVFEIGMNHPGETSGLAAIARPTIAVVNNAQREHQEFMQSVEEVAREHALLIAALPRGGVAVVNADDAFAPLWRQTAASVGAKVRDFGLEQAAAVTAQVQPDRFFSDLKLTTPEGEISLRLPLPGLHNVRNALAAAAAATAAGASADAVVQGLSSFSGVKGRQQRSVSRSGATLIDDTYNANPESVRAAIDVLGGFTKPTVLVLGDMGEVGSQGVAFHREVGGYAHEAGVTHLLGFGELARHSVEAFGKGATHAVVLDDLIQRAKELDCAGTTLLVKGSRFMRMERVVAALAGGAD